MNQGIVDVLLLINCMTIIATTGVAYWHYCATKDLRECLRSATERDGQQYANSFQAMLWQEKKTEMERELVAFKRAHEETTKRLAEMTERFNGLEQAYHELKDEHRDSVLRSIDKATRKARRKAPPLE